MKIGVHNQKSEFSERWIEYFIQNNIDFKIVDAYKSDIIDQLRDCDVFMWEHNDGYFKDILFAKQLLYSLQISGKLVFPDFNTGWFYNDKVGQKYFLETIGAPFISTHIFYSRQEAISWLDTKELPIIFKLRGGAGSANVKLVRTKSKAKRLINKSFSRGFSQLDRWGYFKEKVRVAKEGRDPILNLAKGVGRLLFSSKLAKMIGREKGYVYFQDFVPNNNSDIRVVLIGDKAVAIKRLVRKNDFRASGSGSIVYDKNQIDPRCIKIAFDVNKKINSQCITFDFIFDEQNNPLIIEVGFAYSMHGYDDCQGYWDSELNWYDNPVNLEEWMVMNLIDEYNSKINDI